MSRKSLARKLRVLRAERGLTLRQVEDITGVDKHTISNVERGESKPYDATLARLARGYGVPVSELLVEKTAPEVALPLAEAPQAEHAAPTPTEDAERLIDRPEVQEWLREHGHMDAEEFLSWAEDLRLDITEEEWPEGIERGIQELGEKKDELINALKPSSVHKKLFPVKREGLTGKEWSEATFQPGRLARKLRAEIRREYSARERALVDYSMYLFAEGEAADYLFYGPRDSERARERHRMLEEERSEQVSREQVLREAYAQAVAVR